MEFLKIEVEQLYELFMFGCFVGLLLSFLGAVIAGVIHLFKDIIKIGSK